MEELVIDRLSGLKLGYNLITFLYQIWRQEMLQKFIILKKIAIQKMFKKWRYLLFY